MTKIALLYELCSFLHFQNALHPGQPGEQAISCCFSTLLPHPLAPAHTGGPTWVLSPCTMHQNMANPNILLPHGCSQETLASCWQETQRAAPISEPAESWTWSPAAHRNRSMGIRTAPSQPRALTLELLLLCSHLYNTSTPLTQIRYNWKWCYSSQVTTIISAMTMEKERHRCPKAMLCCSKNGERSPRGCKGRLSWPHYRYSLWTWHANNALLVKKCRCGQLYLNFTMFT